MNKMITSNEKTQCMILPTKWRRSGTDRRQQAMAGGKSMDKRGIKDRRKDWIDVASQIIYPEH